MQAMSERTHVPLVPEQCDVLRRCRDALCKAVEMKFGCTAIFHNLEDSDSVSNASKLSAAELRYFKQLSSGVKVAVWKDDLTRVKVDAVVNAANEGLNHGGGLALALSKAGGPMIQNWSNDIIKKQGKVPTGTAVVTGSGSLPCKKIIHAVGPCLHSNPSQWEIHQGSPILNKTVMNILQIVELENLSSVAIPALSSGLFNFPRDLCANIIVQTIHDCSIRNAFKGRTVEINLVNNDDPTVREMERACRQCLGPPDITGSYSGALKGRDQSTSFSSCDSLQFGNVKLHLRKGLIEEQKVDVIVNTISDNLNLSIGLISKAILNKAGNKIQEELYRNKTRHAKSGDVFVTKGHNLNCAEVYHTICAERSGTRAKQILHKVVFDCLMYAVSAYKSISFPAIGTGNLSFRKHEVAEIMMNAVADFAKKNSSNKLDINFVAFPTDFEMMEAFKNQLKHVMKISDFPSTTTQSSPLATKEPTRSETPTLEINSVSKEALREAQAWIMNMLGPKNDTITIMNNHVIYFGQKDHENLVSLQTKLGVQLAVFFKNGNGGIFITGEPISVSCVAIEVEYMLCQAQNDFALDEESNLLYSVVRWQCKDAPWPAKINAALEKAYLARNEEKIEFHDYDIIVNIKNMYVVDIYGKTSSIARTCMFKDYNPFHLDSNSFYARTPVDGKDYMEIKRKVEDCGLCAIRVEKIENAALQQIFELTGKRIKDKPKCLYQCVSAQFCDLICRIGFHKDFAPPAEQKDGSGIYFSSRLDRALKLWSRQEEEYIYIIQAQVLTGKSVIGSPDFILPPVMGSDPLKRFDSLTDKENTHVIFNGQQALPEYLIICGKPGS